MAMIVKNNMAALNTLNQLNVNQSDLGKALQKVSSGMKINSAGDDASGYAISERMRVQVRSLDQDDDNTQNGNNMLKVAEGAMQRTVDVLRTLKEKAINAANDTNTDEDRAIIQKEIDQLIDQVDDNALVTYNGKYLIDGSKNSAVIGETGTGTATSLTNQSLATDTTDITPLTDLQRRDGYPLGIHPSDTITASWVRGGVVYTNAISPIGTATDVLAMVNIITNTDATFYGDTALVGKDAYGKDVYTADNQPALTIRASNPGVDGQIASVTFAVTNSEGQLRKEVNSVLDDFRETVRAQNPVPDNSLVFQTGTKAHQSINVGLTDMRSVALGLQSDRGVKVQVTTQASANATINTFENALQRVLHQLAEVGAVENRLDYTSSNLITASENVQNSESIIRDSDMAKEMTAYTKANVLTQAAQSMLAQANQNAGAVLSLLQ